LFESDSYKAQASSSVTVHLRDGARDVLDLREDVVFDAGRVGDEGVERGGLLFAGSCNKGLQNQLLDFFFRSYIRLQCGGPRASGVQNVPS